MYAVLYMNKVISTICVSGPVMRRGRIPAYYFVDGVARIVYFVLVNLNGM